MAGAFSVGRGLNQSLITNGLVLYLDAGRSTSYPGTGTTWTDLSSNGKNYTLQNGPTYSSVNGGVITFAGASSQYANSSASLFTSASNNPYTISLWIYPTGAGNFVQVNGQSSINSLYHYSAIEMNSGGTISFGQWNGTETTITTSAQIFNKWYNLVISYNGTTATAYINGVSVGSNTIGWTSPGNTYFGLMGTDAQNMGTNAYASGSIGSFMAYNTALTATQIIQNYNALVPRYYNNILGVSNGLIAYLDAGRKDSYSGSGTTLYDITSNSNNFTLNNAPTYSASTGGGSFLFNGTNQTATLPSLNLQQDFTLMCWVNQNVLNGFAMFGQGTTSNNLGLHMWYINDTTIRFGMYANDTDFTVSTSAGVWYHIVFTYSNTSPYTKSCYINGVAQSGTIAQTQSAYAGSGIFRLGATYSSGGNYGNGYFAGVSVYNRILSASEIAINFNALRSRYGV